MSEPISLSITERLILANQYEILSQLTNKPNDKYDYTLLAEQLRNGHKWLYEPAYKNMKIKKDLSDEDTNFVLDTLYLHDALLESYDQLLHLKETCLHEDDVSFKGFHREIEEHLAGFVHALKKANLFVGIIGAGQVISPRPMTNTYKQMLEKWEQLEKIKRLSNEQILHIIGN